MVRVMALLTSEDLKNVDAWRAERKIWSRSDAIRQLINQALETDRAKSQQGK